MLSSHVKGGGGMDGYVQVVEHLRVIRKYLAWIAFIMVFTYIVAIAGLVVFVVNARSDPSSGFCQGFPDFC
jgi:hypothetical protein